MKEITTSKGIFYFVEVPDNAYDFEMRKNNEVIMLLKDVINPLTGHEKSKITDIPDTKYGFVIKDWKIINTTKNITEKECKLIVVVKKYDYDTYFENYINGILLFDTAKESLNSLIQANGLSLEKNYLILKKN